MKITKELLKQIIKEELGNAQTSDREVFEQIKQICEEALMNKSLGMSSEIAKNYQNKILNLINEKEDQFIDGLPVTDDMP
jgi:hypothetical protein|tara:strand:+ start:709 stop:948 length:240 start_codon:yes stop_codon:yes gene_type:complete